MPTRHYCTYFDRNYCYRALALYESLARHGADFELWVLCFDDDALALLTRLALPGVRLITLAEFEAADPDLKAVKPTRHLREYYWTSTASLVLYILQHAPAADVVAYVDSDLYFYSDPGALFAELGDGSVLIVEHRYAARHAAQAAISGVYNVGTLLFRRDDSGWACARWWRERCLEWCYARPEAGKFGDQKYLDDFPARFANVVVARHPGLGLAPWNLARFPVEAVKGRLTFSGRPLVFYHFHSLAQIGAHWYEQWAGKYNVPRGSAAPVYRPYLRALQRAQTQVQAAAPGFRIDCSRRGPRSLAAAAWSGRLAYCHG